VTPRRTGFSNRALILAACILGVCLLLGMLGCGGIAWMLLSPSPVRQTVEVAAREKLDKPKPPPKQEKTPEPLKQPPQAEPPAKLPEVVVKGNEIKLPEIKLPEIKLPEIKNLDDALAKLKSPDRATKLAALQYIQKQTITDPVKKREAIKAVDPLTEDDDPFVKIAAAYTRAGLDVD
jgi:hypothetical protein